MVQPCCNLVPIKTTAKCIAMCDLILGLIGMIWLIYILDGYEYEIQEERYFYAEDSGSFQPWTQKVEPNQESLRILARNASQPMGRDNSQDPIIFVTREGIIIDEEIANVALSALFTVLNITLCVLLVNAISSKNIVKLKVWFCLRLLQCIIKSVVYVSSVLLGLSLETQAPHVIFTVFHFYGLWMVCDLIKDIKLQNVMRKRPSIIS